MRLFSTELSIRKKIFLSFHLLLVVMIGTAVATYETVRRVDLQVEQVELVTDLINITLELRRFEKNFFLYEQEKDYNENLAYGEKLKELLRQNVRAFHSLSSAAEVDKARETLDVYNSYMRRLRPFDASDPEHRGAWRQWRTLLENIRIHGKEMTDFAEKTARAQKKYIQNLLLFTRQVLVVSLCTFVLLSIFLATFLARRVNQSLKQLERYTRRISQGQFLDIPANKAETEIRAIFQAYNRMSHELRMRQQQLVQSEKLASFGTMLAGVAHELNNPLSNISTSAQILAEEIEGGDTEFKKGLVGQIEEQADKARDIVRILLEFSRAREFEKKDLLLKKLIGETILLIRGKVPALVEIIVEVPEELTIVADKSRMQQVFINLFQNAIDALEESGHIWISARRCSTQESEREEVEIMVEDDGPGIEPENLKRIFDPFFTTKDVGKGSGLGLFIVHDIIEAHGGSIRVDSRLGQGTTFIIWLLNEKQEQE